MSHVRTLVRGNFAVSSTCTPDRRICSNSRIAIGSLWLCGSALDHVLTIQVVRGYPATVTHCNFISWLPIVRVDSWQKAEELLTGSRVKVTLIDPGTGKHYIFKLPKLQREHQIWSELLASYIAGDLLGWEVQHTSIAWRNGQLGNLLTYIYEPRVRDCAQESFIEGWSPCKQVDPDYDVKRGTRHTLPLLGRVCDEVLVAQYGISRSDVMDFWARTFAFDTLISNTDRHAENWAIIKGESGTRMSPLYDNASSLGCGLDKAGLDRAFDKNGAILLNRIEKMRKKGRHHVRVNLPCKHGSNFEDLCGAFLDIYPEGRPWFEEVETVQIDAVRDLMMSIDAKSELQEPYRLSKKRQAHICAMLTMGKERIKNILDKDRFDD